MCEDDHDLQGPLYTALTGKGSPAACLDVKSLGDAEVRFIRKQDGSL